MSKLDETEGHDADPGPAATPDFAGDVARFSAYFASAARRLASLPAKPARNAAEAADAAALLARTRAARERFLTQHVASLYDRLTADRTRFLRIPEIACEAAVIVPGLVPTRQQVDAESTLDQSAKDGIEIDQGLLFAQILARSDIGSHLCHAMLLPLPTSAEHARRLTLDGKLDLGAVHLQRRGKALHFTFANPRFLNAEDDTTIEAMEAAVDAAILDPLNEIVVMRGGPVEHPKYFQRRLFGAGINLTHLYRGRIPYLWYLVRDLGFVHKIMRGLASPVALPDDVSGTAMEKPWIAAVDTFAIGGHCQLLLCMDYVVAASDAYMTLPARKEGIIPGFANLRLPRFVGDRIARQAIQYERRLDCDSPAGRMICDEIVPPQAMDEAVEKVVAGLTSSGVVSAVGNRRAFRVGQEPFDLFRRYAAVYAREQAYCHFSPALIANLERNWDARNRRY